MSDRLQPGDERIEQEDVLIEREMNPDSALLSDFLAGELPPDRAAEVRERLENDPEFRDFAEPLLIAWSVPPVTRPLSRQELERSWIAFRERAGMPPIPGHASDARVLEPQRVNWARVRRTALLAAGIVALVAIPSTWWWTREPNATTIRTTIQSLTIVPLPDGSTVAARENTTIEYARQFATARRVELVGEARFDVVSGASPFSVVTGTAIVTVTGTSFTVQAYPGQPAEVTVHEGAVRVESRQGGRTMSQSVITLRAGQSARVPANSSPEVIP